jgi:hypothetical protein
MRGAKEGREETIKLEPSGLPVVAHDPGTSLLVLNETVSSVFFIAQRSRGVRIGLSRFLTQE